MRTRNFLAFAITFLTPASLVAQGVTPASIKTTDNPEASRLVVMPASNIKWADLGPPGVKVADLWGDHAKGGAFGALFRLPAGFEAPMHTHTYDMKVVILSGIYIQIPDGKPEFRLGPGSYFMQPGAGYRHITRCDTTSDCVFYVESDGPFDLKPVQTAAAPAKQ